MDETTLQLMHYAKIMAGERVVIAALVIALFAMITYRENRKSSKWLFVTIITTIVHLLGDSQSFAYAAGADMPTGLAWLWFFVSYTFGDITFIPFIFYVKAYIQEKTPVNKWLFRVPLAAVLAGVAVEVAAIFSGSVFGSVNGKIATTGGTPAVTTVISFVTILYILAASLTKVKQIGFKASMLLGLFGLVPAAAIFINYDYVTICSGLEVLIIYILLQADISDEKEKQKNALSALNDELKSTNEENTAQLEEIAALNDELKNTNEENTAQLEEIAALNSQLQENQARLEESAAEQEAQLEEIAALNRQLQGNQAELEAALAEQKEKVARITELNYILAEYNNTMANAGTGMWQIILKDGVEPRMKANDKMAELLGIAGQNLSDEERYHAWYDRVAPEAIPSVQASVGEMLAGRFSENTYRWVHPAKGAIYVRCGGTAETLPDGTSILSGYHADVTDIVLAERRHSEELEKARRDAEAANKAKTAFLFNMSHDIRTPMNAIIGFTELLKKHKDEPEKADDYIGKIQSSSEFLLSLINNVLEMARIESGKEQLDETVCATGTVTREILSLFEDRIRQKNITLTSSIDIHTPYMLCDQPKLREICLNILSNAVKYTPEGGSIAIQMQELPGEKPGYARIRGVCADTGIGMSNEFLPHLFEEFTRAQSATESRQLGTGLGMPIVKKLVDLMGGTIEVESEPGKGSTFTVTIDLKIADATPQAKPEGQDPAVNANFKGKRILLAEDNDLNAEIAIEILTEAGFEVDRAADGILCVDMLQKAESGHYDVILMDVQMPNMDGYKATRTIRALNDPGRSSIPILAMTANAFEEDKKNAFAAGMNGHLAKPIEVPKLMAALAEILK